MTKGYLAKLETESLGYRMKELSIQETSIEDGNNWLRALRDCPRELVNLINSRACRGAIMFNDTLTMDQCIRLVQELSVTAYPFQCAHGRYATDFPTHFTLFMHCTYAPKTVRSSSHQSSRSPRVGWIWAGYPPTLFKSY